MKSYKQYYLDQHKLKEPIKKYQQNNPQGVAKYVIYLVNTVKNSQSILKGIENSEDSEEGEKRKTTIVLLYEKVIEELYEIEADIQFFEDKEEVTFGQKNKRQIERFFNKLQREYEKRKKEQELLKKSRRRTRKIFLRELTPYSRN